MEVVGGLYDDHDHKQENPMSLLVAGEVEALTAGVRIGGGAEKVG